MDGLERASRGTNVHCRTPARRCHVLFVSGSEQTRGDRFLQDLAGAYVLTVSDMSLFVPRGGMIQFVAQGGRVRFEINGPAAKAAGLVLSSELLRVASVVWEER